MGHAHLSNLSHFFVKRLHKKGKLTLRQCCEAAAKAGEKLHAGEAYYDDPAELAIGVLGIIHFLSRKDPTSHGYSGPRGGGPWIVPDLSPWLGKHCSVSRSTKVLLDQIAGGNDEGFVIAACADRLGEEGFGEWARWIRELPLLRSVWQQWENDPEFDCTDDEFRDDDGWYVFDYIPWRFAKGWRRRYKEVPRLKFVEH